MAKKGKSKGSVPAKLRYSKPTKNTRGSIGGQDVSRAVEKVCSLTNPFCESSKGARIPDDDSAPSMGIRIIERFHFGTNANGKAAFRFNPGPGTVAGTATTITGDTVTTWAAMSALSDNAALTGSFGQYRIVSVGIRVYTTLAPTNQSGSVKFVTSDALLADGVDMESSLWNATSAEPVAGLDHRWVAKPQGNEWKQYISFGSTADYTRFGLYVTGAPASTPDCFVAEIYFNMEVTPKLGTVAAAGAKPGVPHDQLALTAASKVHSKHNGHHQSPGFFQRMVGLAKGALMDVATAAMPHVGGAISSLLSGRKSSPLMIEYVD